MTLYQLDVCRFSALMNSNNVPSVKDSFEVCRRMAQRQREIKEISGEIERAETQASLDALIKKRQHYQKDLAALKAVVSIIRWLPVEILGEIFVLGCAGAGDLNYIRSRLVLGHVCSRWRMIAHSMPMLWRSLSLFLSPKTSKVPCDIQLTKEWLSRASPLPLDISLSSSAEDSEDSTLEYALLPFVDRMQKLTLSLSFRHLMTFLRLPSAMPLIEVLDLNHPSHERNRWNGRTISFERSSHLHTVIVRSHEFLEMGIVTLPWSQLTELDLKYAHPVDDLLRLLSLSPYLRKFSMAGWAARLLDSAVIAADIIHLNLCELNISLGFSHDVSAQSFFFRHLTLPAIRLIYMNKCGPAELVSLVDLQIRSKFSLETLALNVINSFQDTIDHIITLLHASPSLLQLRLGMFINADDVNRFLEALRYDPEDASRCLAPYIEDIELEVRTYRLDVQLVVDMIKTRWWPGNCSMRSGGLKHLSVNMQSEGPERWGVDIREYVGLVLKPKPAVLQQLREFEREGLKLYMTGFNLYSRNL